MTRLLYIAIAAALVLLGGYLWHVRAVDQAFESGRNAGRTQHFKDSLKTAAIEGIEEREKDLQAFEAGRERTSEIVNEPQITEQHAKRISRDLHLDSIDSRLRSRYYFSKRISASVGMGEDHE